MKLAVTFYDQDTKEVIESFTVPLVEDEYAHIQWPHTIDKDRKVVLSVAIIQENKK